MAQYAQPNALVCLAYKVCESSVSKGSIDNGVHRGLWVQAAVPNPLDGLRKSAEAAKSAVSSPAPQKVFLEHMPILVRGLSKHTHMATPLIRTSASVGSSTAHRHAHAGQDHHWHVRIRVPPVQGSANGL